MYSTSVDLKQAAQSNNGFGHRGHGGAAQAPPESAPQGQGSKTLAATHTMHDATTAGATSPSARKTAHSRLFRRPKPHDSASSPADSVATGSTVNGRVRPAVTATSRLAAHQNYHRFFTPRAKALTSAKQGVTYPAAPLDTAGSLLANNQHTSCTNFLRARHKRDTEGKVHKPHKFGRVFFSPPL
jgi:hypothetical protein